MTDFDHDDLEGQLKALPDRVDRAAVRQAIEDSRMKLELHRYFVDDHPDIEPDIKMIEKYIGRLEDKVGRPAHELRRAFERALKVFKNHPDVWISYEDCFDWERKPGRAKAIWRDEAKQRLKELGVPGADIEGILDAAGLTGSTPAPKKRA